MTNHDEFFEPAELDASRGEDTRGDQDLADRVALRRIGSLSTQLTDITEVEYRELQLERVVLVGVWSTGTAADAEASMTELVRLAETAGSVVLEALTQRRGHPDAATYIGSGKVTELGEIVQLTGADTVICDGELSPGQLRNLEERLKVKVVDRTALILDIFAQHAKSKEGKAQVELAQLNYFLPRLWRCPVNAGVESPPVPVSVLAGPVRPNSRSTAAVFIAALRSSRQNLRQCARSGTRNGRSVEPTVSPRWPSPVTRTPASRRC